MIEFLSREIIYEVQWLFYNKYNISCDSKSAPLPEWKDALSVILTDKSSCDSKGPCKYYVSKDSTDPPDGLVSIW